MIAKDDKQAASESPPSNAQASARVFVTNRGSRHPLPLFLPVYQPQGGAVCAGAWSGEPRIDGLMVNAFFLYKQREVRARLLTECSLAEYVGFDGLLVTDSGAFQGFTRQLYLANKDIVRFQDAIGSDIIAPLDLVTPPQDNRKVADGEAAGDSEAHPGGLVAGAARDRARGCSREGGSSISGGRACASWWRCRCVIWRSAAWYRSSRPTTIWNSWGAWCGRRGRWPGRTCRSTSTGPAIPASCRSSSPSARISSIPPPTLASRRGGGT